MDPHLLAVHVAVCANPFPLMQELPTERLIAYLLDVPGLAQELTFRWQVLDQPPVGSLFLVWCPKPEFPPDGYVWLDESEAVMDLLVQGYVSCLSLRLFFFHFHFFIFSFSFFIFHFSFFIFHSLSLSLSFFFPYLCPFFPFFLFFPFFPRFPLLGVLLEIAQG